MGTIVELKEEMLQIKMERERDRKKATETKLNLDDEELLRRKVNISAGVTTLAPARQSVGPQCEPATSDDEPTS